MPKRVGRRRLNTPPGGKLGMTSSSPRCSSAPRKKRNPKPTRRLSLRSATTRRGATCPPSWNAPPSSMVRSGDRAVRRTISRSRRSWMHRSRSSKGMLSFANRKKLGMSVSIPGRLFTAPPPVGTEERVVAGAQALGNRIVGVYEGAAVGRDGELFVAYLEQREPAVEQAGEVDDVPSQLHHHGVGVGLEVGGVGLGARELRR